MNLEEYKKLSIDERKTLENLVKTPEEELIFQDLKKNFELEISNELQTFKEGDRVLDEVGEGMRLEDRSIIGEVKDEVCAKEVVRVLNKEVRALEHEVKEQIATASVLDIEQFSITYKLSPEEVKNLRKFITEIAVSKDVHSARLGWMREGLSQEVFHSPEIRTLMEDAITNKILSGGDNSGIGVPHEYVKMFGINPEFFADEKFNAFRKAEWKERLQEGGDIDFTSGTFQHRFYFQNEEEDKEKLDETFRGNFKDIKSLFTQEELSQYAMQGIVKILELDSWSSINDEPERMERFEAYKKEFAVDDQRIGECVIEELKRNILNKKVPQIFLDKYPAVKEFYGSEEAKVLAKNALASEAGAGSLNKKALETWAVAPEDIDQDKIIQGIRGGLRRNKMTSIVTYSKCLDDEHFQKVRETVLNLNQEGMKELLGEAFTRNDPKYWPEEVEAFKRLDLPKEVLVSFAQQKVIEQITHGDNYDKSYYEREKAAFEAFGITEASLQEALSVGYYLRRSKNGSLPEKEKFENDYQKERIGLEKLVSTPQMEDAIKQSYLNLVQEGESWNLDKVEAFLDQQQRGIAWNREDITKRKEAVLKGLQKICVRANGKETEDFIKKYYPETHHVFFMQEPRVKEAIAQKMVDTIQSLTWDYMRADASQLESTITHFGLDKQQILNRADAALGFIDPKVEYKFEKSVPEFNISDHNERWALSHGPEAFRDALENKDLSFLRKLMVFGNTKELVLNELKNQELVIKDDQFPETAKNYAADFVLAFFWESSFVDGVSESDRGFIEKLQLHRNSEFMRNLALKDPSDRHEYCETFITKYEANVSKVSKNQPLEGLSDFEYRLVVEEVYPKRNYDSYQHLSVYEDRTKDLEKYAFDREGVEMRLSGVLGYKIKEESSPDPTIISEFSQRIDTIKTMATDEKVKLFLENTLTDSKATTLEGKILEYFKQEGYSVDTMNILLSYQLRGQYDDFVAETTDRVSLEEDRVSKNYILLDELVNRYGDNMKETIKAVQEGVARSPDRDLFTSPISEKYQKIYNEIPNTLIDDLGKIPREKIKDETLQKKIAKTIKNTFQGVENIQKRAEYFASLFSVNDLDMLQEVWLKHMDQLFVLEGDHMIDTSKIEALQSSVYQKLQGEIGKYEEIKEVDSTSGEAKLKKERVIKGYFSKNKENAHARMVGDICLAQDANMLKNEKYFEFVLFDEERQKCMGTSMLLEMNEQDKKYLLYCPNPSVGLVSEVSAKKLYKMITDQVVSFGKDNKFDAILVDKTHGKSTNRAGLFQQSLDQSCLKDSSGKERSLTLKEAHVLGGGYSYQNNLQVVWESGR